MSSRSLSPPSRLRGRRGEDADPRAGPSMARLSLRPSRRPHPYRPRRRAASVPAPAPPADISRDGRPTSPPLSQPQHKEESSELKLDSMSQDRRSTSPPLPCAMVMRPDIHHTPPEPRNQEEWLLEFRLDSPPRVEFITLPEEPHSPTSPPGSPPSIGNPTVEEPSSPTSPPGSQSSIGSPTVSPKRTSFESDPEECHSLDAEEDPYFKSLVDNFIAAADLGKSTLLDDIDMEAVGLRKSNLYAESALKYYNNCEENKNSRTLKIQLTSNSTFVNIIMHQQKLNATIDTAKYELIRVIKFYEMLDDNGCYGHVNFVAKGDQENSDEELFFAELRWDFGTVVPTRVLSLEGVKRIGGLCGTVYGKFKFSRKGLAMDSQHCYGCRPDLQHPKNGELYETGHVAMGCYYHEDLLG
ncbi:hypothetical protein ACP70R_029559 [Stipagrostis hirtigluma subsp. patula]